MALLTKLNRLVLALFMFGLFAVIFVEITLRFFGISLNYSWEAASYLMAAIFFMGCAQAIAGDEHIRIQIPLPHWPLFLRLVRRLSETVVTLALLALTVTIFMDLQQDFLLKSRSYTQLQMPLYVAKLPMFLGALLSLLLYVGGVLTRKDADD